MASRIQEAKSNVIAAAVALVGAQLETEKAIIHLQGVKKRVRSGTLHLSDSMIKIADECCAESELNLSNAETMRRYARLVDAVSGYQRALKGGT